MEPKQSTGERPQEMGEQYLYALIRCARWVMPPYKQLAEKYREDTEILNELYMCACEEVPASQAEKALERDPQGGALKFLRHRMIQKNKKLQQEKAEAIKGTLAGQEVNLQEMPQMPQEIFQQAMYAGEDVEGFAALFPEEGEKAGLVAANDEGIWKEPAKGQEGRPCLGKGRKDIQMPGPVEPAEPAREKGPKNREAPEAGKLPFFSLQALKRQRQKVNQRKSVTAFLTRMVEEGYTTQQMDYLISCVEDGLDVKEIEAFASPKLPVEVMRRLRWLKESR